MPHITEILPDLDKMPDWAREAFEAGQFFNVAFKRVEKLELTINSVKVELRAHKKGMHSPTRFIQLIDKLVS